MGDAVLVAAGGVRLVWPGGLGVPDDREPVGVEPGRFEVVKYLVDGFRQERNCNATPPRRRSSPWSERSDVTVVRTSRTLSRTASRTRMCINRTRTHLATRNAVRRSENSASRQ